MRRSLEIWESLQDKQLDALHMSLLTPGVSKLVCSDYNTLWALAGQERQEDLQVVARRVAVLGTRCADSRLQCLLSVVQNVGAGGPPSSDADVENLEASTKETELLFRFFQEQIDAINNLKWEMEALQLLHTRIRVHGESHKMADVAEQEEVVKKVQYHCIWSQELDLIVRLLVMMVAILRRRILFMFGPSLTTNVLAPLSLGRFGFALHYAHIIIFIEKIIHFPNMVMGSSREDLYVMLPRDVQVALRKRLRLRNGRPIDAELESKLKRSMNLLAPLAHNTLSWQSAHTPGSNYFPKHVVFKVQTLEYAQKESVNEILVDALTGLSCICGAPPPNSRGRTKRLNPNYSLNNGQSIPAAAGPVNGALGNKFLQTDSEKSLFLGARKNGIGNGHYDEMENVHNANGRINGYTPPPLMDSTIQGRMNGAYQKVPANLNAPIRIQVEDANGVDWMHAFTESETKKYSEDDASIAVKRNDSNHESAIADGSMKERVTSESFSSKLFVKQRNGNSVNDIGVKKEDESRVEKDLVAASRSVHVCMNGNGADIGPKPENHDGMNGHYNGNGFVHEVPSSDDTDDESTIEESRTKVLDSLSLYVRKKATKSKLNPNVTSKDWNEMVNGMVEKMGNTNLIPPIPPLISIDKKMGGIALLGNSGEANATSASNLGSSPVVQGDEKVNKPDPVASPGEISEELKGNNYSKKSIMDSPPSVKENDLRREWMTISSVINQVKQHKKFPTSSYERPWKFLPQNLQDRSSDSGVSSEDPAVASNVDPLRPTRRLFQRRSTGVSWSESRFQEMGKSAMPRARSIDFTNSNSQIRNDAGEFKVWRSASLNLSNSNRSNSNIRPNERVGQLQSKIFHTGSFTGGFNSPGSQGLFR